MNYSLEDGTPDDLFQRTDGQWVDRHGRQYRSPQDREARQSMQALNRLFWEVLPPDLVVAKADKTGSIEVKVRHGEYNYTIQFDRAGGLIPARNGLTKYVAVSGREFTHFSEWESEVMQVAWEVLSPLQLATIEKLFADAIAPGNPAEVLRQREEKKHMALEQRRRSTASLSDADILLKFDERLAKIRTKSTAWVSEPPAKTAAGWWRCKVMIDGNEVELVFMNGSWSKASH